MKTKKSFLTSLALATTLVAGLGLTSARADVDPAAAPASSTVGQGLLGQVYGALTYSYIDLDGVSSHADDYHFSLNQPLSFGLDGFLSYDFIDFDGGHSNVVLAGVRPFSTRFNWGKPYVEAAAGYAWTSGDNSFVWQIAAGAELQVSPEFTVTPYVKYTDAPDLAGDGTWNFGAKGNYWVNSQWAVTAGVNFDDDSNVGFTVGTNFRF
jgi:hypothetical protein